MSKKYFFVLTSKRKYNINVLEFCIFIYIINLNFLFLWKWKVYH